MRFKVGTTDYLEVLTNNTAYFSAELELAQAEGNECTALVQFYQVWVVVGRLNGLLRLTMQSFRDSIHECLHRKLDGRCPVRRTRFTCQVWEARPH